MIRRDDDRGQKLILDACPIPHLLLTGNGIGDQSGRTGSMPRGFLSVREAAAFLGIGRTLAYQATRDGRIPSVRISGRILIPVAALAQLASGQLNGASHVPADAARRQSRQSS
jgi:excisionase family DNA binding protein